MIRLCLLGLVLLAGCQAGPSPGTASPQPERAAVVPPRSEKQAPVPPPQAERPDPLRLAFREEARTMANLALSHKYEVFTERWNTFAAACAAAGLALDPRDDDERAYQALRTTKAFIGVWTRTRNDLRVRDRNELRKTMDDCQVKIEKTAREAEAYVGPPPAGR